GELQAAGLAVDGKLDEHVGGHDDKRHGGHERQVCGQAEHFFILGDGTSWSNSREKWKPVFRPELRPNNKSDRVLAPVRRRTDPASGKPPAKREQAACSASLLAICFFSSFARCESSDASALARKASRPLRCSTERSAFAETRRRTFWFSA